MIYWNRITGGVYESPHGYWKISREGRKWFVYASGELWGEWERGNYGKDYVPFNTLQEAKDLWDEYAVRGVVRDAEDPIPYP